MRANAVRPYYVGLRLYKKMGEATAFPVFCCAEKRNVIKSMCNLFPNPAVIWVARSIHNSVRTDFTALPK